MSATRLKVLVVDDELPIRKLLRMGLRAEGYELLEASDRKETDELLRQNPDLIILDLDLVGAEGFELLRAMRRRDQKIPIVALSNDEFRRAQALDQGASGYVAKPFSMDEVISGISSAMHSQPRLHGEPPIFRSGDLEVDLRRRVVRVAGRQVRLSPKEHELLQLLVQHAGKVLTHKYLLGELRNEPTDAQYLRVYVRQLRQKIEADPEHPQHILTEAGIGYRLRAPQG